MAYDIPPPAELPEPGYYYHFKHDPGGPLNNYAYYIYGVGHHTEGDCRAEDAFMQVYRPLYEEAVDGRTLVLSIHQLGDAQRVCDRLVPLSGGRVMGVGTLVELTASARLPIGTDLEEVFLALV